MGEAKPGRLALVDSASADSVRETKVVVAAMFGAHVGYAS